VHVSNGSEQIVVIASRVFAPFANSTNRPGPAAAAFGALVVILARRQRVEYSSDGDRRLIERICRLEVDLLARRDALKLRTEQSNRVIEKDHEKSHSLFPMDIEMTRAFGLCLMNMRLSTTTHTWRLKAIWNFPHFPRAAFLFTIVRKIGRKNFKVPRRRIWGSF